MITKLYSFYDTPFDHDVCHLFEHIVMRQFLDVLENNGYNRAFFGWLDGRTIDSTIFFDLGAYSDDIAHLFDTYLESLHAFDMSVVRQSLAHIEAEMECIIEVTDEDLMHNQFEWLSDILRGLDIPTDVPTVSPLKTTYEPGNFQEVAILVNVFSVPDKTRKAFLCLYPAVLDIVRSAGIDNEAAYPTGKSALAINDDGIGIGWRFTIKKNVNIKKLEDNTNQYLRNFNLKDSMKHIDEYRLSFAHDSWHNAAPIRFYEQTGIRVTRKEIAELSTDVRMMEIMNNMTVRFTPVKGKLKKIEWDY